MIIVLTGLHGSGKSYFANNICKKYGFEIIYKNDLIKKMCEKKNINSWHNWYIENFNKDFITTTIKILQNLPKDKDVILDSIHSYDEWMVAKKYLKDVYLALIIAPEDIRKTRYEKDDFLKDIKRINYYHNKENNNINCLYTCAIWSFNGIASDEINEKSFLELLNYIDSNKTKENKLERKKKL